MLVSEGDDIAVDDRFGRESGRIYLTGIQALARLPVGDDPAAKSSTAPGHRTHCSPISACQRYIPPTFRMCSIWDYTQWPCRGVAGCGVP